MLTIRGLSKAYAAPVLVDAALDVRAGEVHALMGANGAGKSTLVRIVCGLTPADAGTMTLAGAPYAPTSRRAADAAGVQVVLQELNLVASLSVAENLFLARLPHRFGILDRATLHTRAVQALDAVGLGDLDPRTPVHRLGVGHQQLVEIAAALTRECRVLVLDEPTAALGASEVARLFAHIRRLREQGLGILYITHRIDEIGRIADRVTVLRDGRVVDTRAAASFDQDVLLELTVGPAAGRSSAKAPLAGAPPTDHDRRGLALHVHGLSRGRAVRDVSFHVGTGEIVGMWGLVGAGRTETLRLIFGADQPDAGHVCLGDGPPVRLRSPVDAVKAGIGLLPEDRRTQALLLTQPVRANITLAAMARVSRGRTWIDSQRETQVASTLATRLDVRGDGLEQLAGTLSGGNQQKTVLGRWLLRDCAVLLVDEPTRGIDIGAKQAIHEQLRDLAAHGTALVVVSSELEELMAISDRIVVLSAGRVTGTFARGEWSEALLMQAAFGGQRSDAGSRRRRTPLERSDVAAPGRERRQ